MSVLNRLIYWDSVSHWPFILLTGAIAFGLVFAGAIFAPHISECAAIAKAEGN